MPQKSFRVGGAFRRKSDSRRLKLGQWDCMTRDASMQLDRFLCGTVRSHFQ